MRLGHRCWLLAAAWVLVGCDEPCKEYWSVACAKCGESDPGCDSAKTHAKADLKAGGACQAETATLSEVLAEPGGKELVCSLPRKGGPPGKNLRGSWNCNGVRLNLGVEQVRVGEASFQVVQFSTNWLNLKLDSSRQTSCNLHPDGNHLRLECATPLGALHEGSIDCQRIE